MQRGLQEIASRFFRDHLTWPARLLQATRARAQTEFYRGLAAVTDEFLSSEAGLGSEGS